MAKYFYKSSAFLLLFSLVLLGQNTSRDLVSGKVILFESEILKEKRGIYISVPTFYENSEERYPVLFVLDAEGNFPFATGMMHFLGQTGRQPKMIVVGIPNTDRGRDFTPSVIADYKSGGADQFIRFLKEELFPYVEENYRTEPFKVLYGHSLTGMFSIYCLNKEPDLFQAHIAVSPALNYDNNYLFRRFNNQLGTTDEKHRFLYMAVGNEPRFLPVIEKYEEILDDVASDNLHWKYNYFEKDDHNSVRLKALYEGLEFIYNDWMIDAEHLEGGYETIRNHYLELSEKYGYKMLPNEDTLNRIGYIYLRGANFDDAIKIFKYNVELYPESANVYDSLGDAFEKKDDPERALENYKVAVELSEKQNLRNKQVFVTNLNRIKKILNK